MEDNQHMTNPNVATQDPGDYMKLDYGKPRVDLIPAIPLLELGKLFQYGAEKYSANRWREGMPWSRVSAALFRHYLKWMAGEDIDPETGLSHVTAIAWNAVVLEEYRHTHPDMDDRYHYPPVHTEDQCDIPGCAAPASVMFGGLGGICFGCSTAIEAYRETFTHDGEQ